MLILYKISLHLFKKENKVNKGMFQISDCVKQLYKVMRLSELSNLNGHKQHLFVVLVF